MPPLIDRDLLSGDWERNVTFAQARPLTADQRPVVNYFWSGDSRLIVCQPRWAAGGRRSS